MYDSPEKEKMGHKRVLFMFGFGIALLLIISSLAVADTTKETAKPVETPAFKKSPIATGFPFAIVLLGMGICVWIGLSKEVRQS